MFLGDSVSTQLAQFLICDLARSGVPSIKEYSTDLLVKGFTPTVSEFRFSDSILSALSQSRVLNRRLFESSRSRVGKSHGSQSSISRDSHLSQALNEASYILRVHSAQFNLPCIHYFPTGCETPESSERLAAEYITTLLDNYTHFSSPKSYVRTIIILNYGLHLRAKHAEWAVPGMIKSILEVGKKYRSLLNAEGLPQVLLLYRETSSQVFTSNNCKLHVILNSLSYL